MKINPISNPNFVSGVKKPKTDKAQAKSSVSQGADQVSFSKEALSFAKTLAEVRDAQEAESPQRQARVNELADQVRSGQYKVDSEKVAERMIDTIVFKIRG